MARRILYLAYGSNLHPARLRLRTPSAECLGTLKLRGWELRFNKRSEDGSAKCNVVPVTGAPEGVVHTAVYAIDPPEGAALDRAEGEGYGRRRIQIPEYGGVFLYVARPHYVDEGLQPYRWYRDLVIVGARHHGFPAGYIAALEAVGWVEDPDRGRASRHESVLAAARDREDRPPA